MTLLEAAHIAVLSNEGADLHNEAAVERLAACARHLLTGIARAGLEGPIRLRSRQRMQTIILDGLRTIPRSNPHWSAIEAAADVLDGL